MDWQKRFKAYLVDKGLSKTEVAARMGVTGGALGHWLSGIREINLNDFMRLCKVSEADPKHILFGETSLITEIRELVRQETKVTPPSPPKKQTVPASSANKSHKNKQIA